jgi:hypothetical protein
VDWLFNFTDRLC